jgi:hypothetical protein
MEELGMSRFLKLVSIGLLCAIVFCLGQVQVANAAKPTKEEKILEKEIQQEKKQIKKDIQQIHKDMVKKDDAGRLPADEAKLAQDQALLQAEEKELSGLLGSASK